MSKVLSEKMHVDGKYLLNSIEESNSDPVVGILHRDGHSGLVYPVHFVIQPSTIMSLKIGLNYMFPLT